MSERERVFFGTVAAHRAKVDALYARVRDQVLRVAANASVEHVGSSALPDGLTNGDLDVQVRVRAEDSKTPATRWRRCTSETKEVSLRVAAASRMTPPIHRWAFT